MPRYENLIIALRKHTSREVLSFKVFIYEGKCGTFTQRSIKNIFKNKVC